MRTTKAYSFDSGDMAWIRRMERDARRRENRRAYSKHLVHILKYYFDHQRILKHLNKRDAVDVRAEIA